jgi:competence protein ComEC
MFMCCVVIAGICGGAREWSRAQADIGPCVGWARVQSDPRGTDGFAALTLQIGGRRFAATAHGGAAFRAGQLRAGDIVHVEGECGPVRVERRSRDLIAHVTGEMLVRRIGGPVLDGGGMWRAANRVRTMASRGTRWMSSDDGALFSGLVLGDDSRQPRSMVLDFRESGLAHLCSASGQNVAYLLAGVSPLLRRLGRRLRLAATLGIVLWFVFLTRTEPSVLRAAAMAAVTAVHVHAGRPVNGRRVFATAVFILLVVDPMLGFSVGFMLSAGATAGLAWLSRPIGEILGLPAVVSTTLAATAGTLPVTLAVFGRASLVALIANPIAVPVAGGVMLVGLPLALVAALAPAPVGVLVCTVVSVPVSFVAVTAHVAALVEPHGIVAAIAWSGFGMVVWHRARCRRRVAG